MTIMNQSNVTTRAQCVIEIYMLLYSCIIWPLIGIRGVYMSGFTVSGPLGSFPREEEEKVCSFHSHPVRSVRNS